MILYHNKNSFLPKLSNFERRRGDDIYLMAHNTCLTTSISFSNVTYHAKCSITQTFTEHFYKQSKFVGLHLCKSNESP